MDRNMVLHIIRNPYGWPHHIVRKAMLAACDMLEGHDNRGILEQGGYDFLQHGIQPLSKEWEKSVEECIEIMMERAAELKISCQFEPALYQVAVSKSYREGFFPDWTRCMAAMLTSMSRAINGINVHYWYGTSGYQTV